MTLAVKTSNDSLWGPFASPRTAVAAFISLTARLIAFLCLLGGVAAAPGADATSGTQRLLVIAPDAFEPALKEFVAFKQQSLPTKLVSLESVLVAGEGVDDPEKLKRFLYAQWKEKGLRYVLLVGDVDVLPVRYMVLDRVTPAAFDYSFYPCDLYYSDLARQDGSFDDWNGRKEDFHAGYFGEVRGEKNKNDPINYDQVDYLPEIAVGRWPVSSPAEVSMIAQKTIRLERASLARESYKPRAAFVAVGGWVDSRSLMNSLVGRLTSGWTIEKRFYQDGESPGGELLPTHEQVLGLFNLGVDLVVHTGHGQPDGWEQCFSVSDLDRITNSTAAVVLSAGCSTAYFAPLAPYGAYVDVRGKAHTGTDHGERFEEPPPPPAPYQKGEFNPTGLGEQMLKRNPRGAVAYIGCNTGSQPCGLTLVEGFVSALSEQNQPRLGDCWVAAIRHYYVREKLADLKPNDDWYPPSIFFQGMKFMLFGDPSLRMPANGVR